MIALDTNVLVHAHRSDAVHHVAASDAVRGLARAPSPWCIPWPCVHEFLAIATHPRVFDPPSPLDVALMQVDAWTESPSLVLIGEDNRSWGVVRATLEKSEVTGPRVHDARIAALCARHGVSELWTADRDFGRFPDLRVRNPLVG